MKFNKIIFVLLIILGSCKPYGFIGDDTVQMSQRNDMHFVHITLNGKPAKLLLDIGASKTLLDISKSEKYGFQYVLIGESKYIGIGGTADLYAIYDVKVDELFIHFLGSDLSEISDYFEKDGTEIVGILGADFLEKYKVIMDFNDNTIYYKSK